MKVYLVRVFADTSTVGYYSPLLGDCPVLLPVPEHRLSPDSVPVHLDPTMVIESCSGRPLAWYMPVGEEWPLHRDPRLDLGFYTEPLGRRGRLPRDVGGGWLLVFAAGLAAYPEGFWSQRRRRSDILGAFHAARRMGLARVYAVGVLEVRSVLEVRDWTTAPGCLLESPHSAVGEPTRAFVGRGFLLDPPVPLEPAWGPIAERLAALARGRFRLGPLGGVEVLEWLSTSSRLVYTGECDVS